MFLTDAPERSKTVNWRPNYIVESCDVCNIELCSVTSTILTSITLFNSEKAHDGCYYSISIFDCCLVIRYN